MTPVLFKRRVDTLHTFSKSKSNAPAKCRVQSNSLISLNGDRRTLEPKGLTLDRLRMRTGVVKWEECAGRAARGDSTKGIGGLVN